MSILRWLAAALIALPLVAGAESAPRLSLPQGFSAGPALAGVSEYRLPNGLQVLLIPDASQDTTTVAVTYLVGSRHEGYGERGMAHLLEHMLFKGTPRHENIKGEFLKHGVRYNGTTSYDRTNYFGTFPASDDNLAALLDLEADRMVNSEVSKADLDSEMTVVRNEFESGENSPFSLLRDRMIGTAYHWHNYGRSVIGTRSDIENVPIDRLQAFYRKYYQPDNATLVIAGRFDPQRALELVNKYFAPVPKPARILHQTYTTEPPQDGERRVVLRRVGEVQLVAAMYHMPPGSDPSYAAVDLLTQVLTNRPSGRLHKALVETGKATSSFGTERQTREAGSAYFGAAVPKGQSLDAARDTLLEVLEGFAADPVTDEELNRARVKLQNDIDDLLTNSRALAITLSEFIAMGDWRLLFWYQDQIGKTTREDVQRVATTYLRPENRTLGIFIPTAKPTRVAMPPVPDVQAMLKDFTGAETVAAGEAFDPTPANLEARLIRRELPGGIKLAMLPKRTRGAKVNAVLTLHWGDEKATMGRSAACNVASAMLARGTTKHTRAELSDALDKLRADVSVSISGASIDTVRENFPEALRLTVEMLREPSFPESEFTQVKQSMLTSIDVQKNDPSVRAGRSISRHLNPYPDGHWLATPTLEERAAAIAAVTLEDARRCHADFLGASNSELAVVGDFDAKEIGPLAESLLGNWKTPSPYERIASRYFDAAAMTQDIVTPDKANAVYRAGFNLPLRDDDADFPALVLGNYIIGGSSDSRLWRRIREQDGLSYSVGSWLTAGSRDAAGEFGVSAIYAPQNRVRLETAVHEEIKRALDEGFTNAEVADAAKGFLKRRHLARNSDSGLASRISSYLDLGRTFKWDEEFEARIASLKAADVNDALRRHFSLDKLSVVKAGDFAPTVTQTSQKSPE
ncbi:MAG: pitrilysin family protein [Burkholderiales bacterium]